MRNINLSKISAFPGIALILFFVFACTLPSEVEVTGSPTLRFAANINFGDYFSDMITDIVSADSDTKTVPCTNPSYEYLVFLLRMEIFRKEDYRCEVDESSFVGNVGTIIINDTELPVELIENGESKKYFVTDNDETIAESDKPYSLSFKGLEDYLEGFEFIGVHSKVYIYGTQLADAVTIDIYQVDGEGNEELIIPDEEMTKGPSGVESLDEYTGLELPPGGADIDITDIINSGGDLALKYKIYMPAGSEIDYEWIDITHTIVAEIIIWLPMTFDSVEENAIFKFPKLFNGVSDIIKSLAETGCVEDMNIQINIDPLNPFAHGLFVINDEGYGNITSSLDDYNFFINLNDEEVDYINKNPFNPRFFVLYPALHSLLEIPKGDILISTVSINADFIYNAEFK